MTWTIDLPDELATRLNALLPEEERGRFAVSAIAEALSAQEQDSAECVAAVEEALTDAEMGRTISLDDEKARWLQQKAVLLAQKGLQSE
jgi:predicted transcriptional regulator